MHAVAAAVATTTFFQIVGRTAAIAVSTSSSRDTCLSRWSKVVTGLTPSIPLRSRIQSSCWVTESRDFGKYPKNSIFVETGSWSLSLCACPASSPTYSQNLFMPTQTHTGDSEAHPAACALQCWYSRLSVSLLWFDTGIIFFHPSHWWWLFFSISLPQKHLLGFFFSQSWRGYEKHQFCPQKWGVLIERCEVNTAIIHRVQRRHEC